LGSTRNLVIKDTESIVGEVDAIVIGGVRYKKDSLSMIAAISELEKETMDIQKIKNFSLATVRVESVMEGGNSLKGPTLKRIVFQLSFPNLEAQQ